MWGLWPLVTDGIPTKADIAQFWKTSGKTHAYRIGLVLMGIGIGAVLTHRESLSWNTADDSGAIVWNFAETARGRGYFLNMQKPTNGEMQIIGFGAHGKNIGSEPITDFEGYVRSDITNQSIPLYIVAAQSSAANVCTMNASTLPQDTMGIPGFADFDVVTNTKPIFLNVISDEAVPLSKFMSSFVPFTVVTKYNGKKYQRQFTKEEVQKQVAILEKVAAPVSDPHVVKRSSTVLATPVPLPTLSTLLNPPEKVPGN
jgi:hypothetical protein